MQRVRGFATQKAGQPRAVLRVTHPASILGGYPRIAETRNHSFVIDALGKSLDGKPRGADAAIRVNGRERWEHTPSRPDFVNTVAIVRVASRMKARSEPLPLQKKNWHVSLASRGGGKVSSAD